MHLISVGGEQLPHQPLGFLAVWAITTEGHVFYRTDVHRTNPEGSRWFHSRIVEPSSTICIGDGAASSDPACTPPVSDVFAVDLCVSPIGTVFVLTDDNQIYRRVGISWRQPYGTSWQLLLPALLDLVDHEQLTSISVGRRAAWVLANTGRCWFRTGLNPEDYPSTAATKTSSFRVNHWVAIPGRLKVLQSSPSDEVFAVDRASSRLLFRSGISHSTPGGEAWIPLQLPILWTLEDGLLQPEEGDSIYSNKHLPLHECIELLYTILLQFEANKSSVCHSPSAERMAANESKAEHYSESHSTSLQDKISNNSSKKLAFHLHRFVRSSTKQRPFPIHLNHLLDSFRRLVKESTDPPLPEVFSAPFPGLPPSVNCLGAGALNSCYDTVPVLWRVAGFVFSDLSRASLFTADRTAPDVGPEWLSSLNEAFDESVSEMSLLPIESISLASPEPSWTCTYKVDVLSQTSLSLASCSSESTKPSPERRLWIHGESVVVIAGADYSSRKVKLLTDVGSGRSHSLSYEDPESAGFATTIKKWDCVDCQDILWCGTIDSTSCIIPRLSSKDSSLGSPVKSTPRKPTHRKHSVHGCTPYELATFDLSLPQHIFTHNYDSGHLVGVFFKRNLTAASPLQQMSSQDEDSDSVFINDDRNACMPPPAWVLRFSSKEEASSWIDLVTPKSSTIITGGSCDGHGMAWLVSELREIFCAYLPADTQPSTAYSHLHWTKVAGHLASVESVHTPVGQITWGLGHDGVPWAFRSDWAIGAPLFSSRKFEFDFQNFQTDCRQVEIYEYQAWRMLKGFSSSRPIGDCSAMWCKDSRRQLACGLSEVRLPSAFCRWQSPWRVDCNCHGQHAVSNLLPFPGISRDLERPAPTHPDESLRSFSSSSSPLPGQMDFPNSGSDPALNLPTSVPKLKGPLQVPAQCPGLECSCDVPAAACDEEGWQYASRLTSMHFGLRLKWNSGARRRRWTRTYAVRLKAPWQEIGPLRLRSLCFVTSANSVNVWAITLTGELVCRPGVSASNPAGTSWLHHPVNRELFMISACPSGRLWALCRRFGRLWVTTQPVTTVTAVDDAAICKITWVSMGLSPQGLAWSLASVGRLAGDPAKEAGSSVSCVLWCVDTCGQLWMSMAPEFTDEGLLASAQDGTLPIRWSFVCAPMISHLSCGPHGQVWAVFLENQCLAVRVGISPSCPQGTGWQTVLQGIVSSASIRGAASP
uniref:Tectonin beta-propeller repeat-containing protein n=2 Tax=Schistocephalus solidus TaxID=70667 RepID=A0A0X3PTS3_SCHSO